MAYTNIKFQTDQSGANSNVCSGTSQIFNFSLADTYKLVGAYISLKKGSSTTASISIDIHSGANGTGTIVASSAIAASSITQSYTDTGFLFNNIILSPNIPYSLVISSSTSCSGSSPYSMKSGNFQVLNYDTGGQLSTGYGVSANILNICSLSATSTLTKGQKIYLSNNKTAKYRLGSKIPKIYRGNTILYNPNNQ